MFMEKKKNARIEVDENTQFAVLGVGKFARSLVKTLYNNGFNVLCCDLDEHVLQEIAPYAAHVYQADVSDKATLKKIGINDFDVVIIAFTNDFEAEAVTAIILKEMGARYIVAKASGERQKQIFEAIGVDRVVLPEEEMGERVAYSFITNDLLANIHRSGKYAIIEMKPQPEWVGKDLQSLKLRQTEGFNIIAIIREGEVMAMLDGETVLLAEDSLITLKPRSDRLETK